jgi:predicted TIM-barrel fold metal-dependent hydrolase
VDAHVHLFPNDVFDSIWKWFDKFGWPVRYKLPAAEVPNYLLSRGVGHVVALHYAHRPGVARGLNRFMANLCHRVPRLSGMATVFPGEPGVPGILKEAFALGLKGVKLHPHVQCFEIDGDEVMEICRVCQAADKPLVMHAGREPKSPAYRCDPYVTCGAVRVERILRAYPDVRLCVPHLGADEFVAYQRMLEDYDNLWLDTTMTLADYLPGLKPLSLKKMRIDRIMYGSDFPNIPYAWDRELRAVEDMKLTRESLNLLLSENAASFFGLELRQKQDSSC